MLNLEYLRRKKVFISLSGGADSSALLILLARQRKMLDCELEAVHFNHGLRGKDVARREADFCRRLCAHYYIKLRIIDLDLDGAGGNLESRARAQRLAQWENLAGKSKNCVIVPAHHAGDRLENFFLRFVRGANISALDSPRVHQKIGKLDFFRPLLGMSKEQLLQVLAEAGIKDFCHDASNDDPGYATRNFFRHQIIGEVTSRLDYADSGMMRSLAALRQDARFIETEAAKAFDLLYDGKSREMNLSKLRELPDALQVRVLKLFISEMQKSESILNADFIDRFKSMLDNGGNEPRRLEIDSASFLLFQKDHLYYRVEEDKDEEIIWHWRTAPCISYGELALYAEFCSDDGKKKDGICVAAFDADMLPDKLVVSVRRNTDKMLPFGRNSAVSVKKLFTDAKIAAIEQRNYPIVRDDDGRIYWIAGLRRSNLALLTDKTRNIVCLRLEKKV